MTELRAPGKKDVTLGAVTHNVQTEAKYRAALKKAIANMSASYAYWLRGKFRDAVGANVDAGRLPDIAQDAAPKDPRKAAQALQSELQRLRAYWDKHFKELAAKLARDIAQDWVADNTRAWSGKLKRAGFDIQLQVGPAQRLFLEAKIPENVALIRSIQQDYHKDVEGIISRNFLAGRDLHTMADALEKRYEISTRRAALMARDQSNKASAQLNSSRQRELGIQYAVWVHSSAGKEPRHKHVKAGRDRAVFDINVGIDFNDGFGPVLPGEAINCRCTSRSIIPGIGRGEAPKPEDVVSQM